MTNARVDAAVCARTFGRAAGGAPAIRKPVGGGSRTRFRLLCACLILIFAAAFAGRAPAQQIKPLDVEQDPNGVNLLNGQVETRLPVLSVPGAPNLRLQRLQDLQPVLSGMLVPNSFGEATYDINSGAATSEHFDCDEQGDCISKKRNGSGLIAEPSAPQFTYYEGGTGRVVVFDQQNGPQGPIVSGGFSFYPSYMRFPDGEVLSFTYQTATSGSQVWRRPTSVRSGRGYTMTLTYQGQTYGQAGWSELASAYITQNGSTAVLARLTYSGDNVTDLAGRTWTCVNCRNSLASPGTTTATSLRLPGETGNTFLAEALPRSYPTITHSNWVTRVNQDGVDWNYAYVPGYQPQTTISRVTITAPLGFSRTVNIHTASNVRPRITSVVNSISGTTSYQYDNDVRVTRITYPEGNAVSVTYDLYGNITERRRIAKPGSGLADIVESAGFPPGDFCYSPDCFRPIWTRDALNRQTNYSWSPNHGGMLDRLEPADSTGRRRRTINEYDTSGRLIRERVCQTNSSGANITCGTISENVRRFTYWGSTLLPETETLTNGTDSASRTTTHSYDAAGRLLSTDGPLAGTDDAVYNRYDTAGRRTWEIGPLGSDGYRPATRTSYRTSDDQVTGVETGVVDSPTDTTLTVLSNTLHRYDSLRRRTRTTALIGSTERSITQFGYDARNRLDCTSVRMNTAAWPSLPAACTLSTQGSSGPDRITRNLYDAESRVLTVQQAVGTTLQQNYATYTYSANGNRTSVKDANGNLATMTFDGHDRQTRWTFPSASTPGQVNTADYEAYGYDANGNRTSLRRRDGLTIAYQYDALNRMVVKVVPERTGLAAAHARDVHYGYDIGNRMTFARFDSATGADGVTNSYNSLGQLTGSTIAMYGQSRALSYAIDAGGRRTQLTYPNAAAVTFGYDAAGRMTGIYEGAGTAAPLWTYAWSDFSRRVRRTATGGQYVEAQADGLGRMTSLTTALSGTAHDNATTFSYNPASQIGSRTISNNAYAWTAHVNVDRPYVVNGLNQYETAGSADFDYDANGNLTGDGASDYVYDVENRLVSATGATTAGLMYDPLGRLWQTSGGAAGTVRFVYDGDELVAEYNSAGTLLRRYVHGSGVDDPVVWYEGAGLTDRRWLTADHQGSIVGISGQTATVGVNSYDEYGIPAAANIGRFQFTGQAWIPELRMYHYKARIYSPTLGRFLQTDPVGYDDDVNLYGYVENDPVNYQDPEGERRVSSQRPYYVNVPRTTSQFFYARSIRARATEARSVWSGGTRFFPRYIGGPSRADASQAAAAVRAIQVVGPQNINSRSSLQPDAAGAGIQSVLRGATFQPTPSGTAQFHSASTGTAARDGAFQTITGSAPQFSASGAARGEVNLGNGMRAHVTAYSDTSRNSPAINISITQSIVPLGSHIAREVRVFEAKVRY